MLPVRLPEQRVKRLEMDVEHEVASVPWWTPRRNWMANWLSTFWCFGYAGSEHTTRRAVAQVKRDWRAGRRRVHRPWVPDHGDLDAVRLRRRSHVNGVVTQLFYAWLAWCRFRVVRALLGKTAPSVIAAIDAALRTLGGAPTYCLTDNEKTVAREHVAGVAVRNRQMLGFCRHYGLTIATCVPADPATSPREPISPK